MSDIEVFKPKTSPIDVLNNYKFTEDEIKRLEYVYTREWDLYVKGLTQFIDQSILDKVKGIKLCVSKITTGDPDKWIDINEVFSEAKRQAFVKWLFKSHIMALRDCDRAIGNSIDHHLPILFRIYINEGRYKRLLSEDLLETAKIEDFNKLTQLVIDSLNEAIGPYFELDVVSGVTTEDRFQYIPVNVKMKTIYQQSEDTYIKSFLAHLVVERNKQTGLEEFHRSVELFGFGKKKQEEQISKFVEKLKLNNVDIISDINNIIYKIKLTKKFKYINLYEYFRISDSSFFNTDFKHFGNNIDILNVIAKKYFKKKDSCLYLSFLFDSMPIYDFKKDMIDINDNDDPQHIYKNDFINKLKNTIVDSCKTSNLSNLIFDKLIRCESNPDDWYESTDGKLEIGIEIRFKFDISKYLNSKENLEYSEELFGFGKKKENKSEKNIDFEKLPGFKKEIFEKCISLFKRAWNYKAYKLPTDMGKIQPGYEEQFDNEDEINERRNECGFNKYIGEEEGHWIDRDPTVKSDKLIISGEGIFDFAYGQPTEFVNYNKTLKDISTRWSKRLSEKEPIVKEYLSKFYNNMSVSTNVDTGDGDEGCVYPEYTIEIPISELQKPIKKSKEETIKLCKDGYNILKKAFEMSGNPKGFKLYSDKEIKEVIDEYINGETTSIWLGRYDAWEFTDGRARDEDQYEKFTNVQIEIENNIKTLSKRLKFPYTITCEGGDWDDGFYEIYLN